MNGYSFLSVLVKPRDLKYTIMYKSQSNVDS